MPLYQGLFDTRIDSGILLGDCHCGNFLVRFNYLKDGKVPLKDVNIILGASSVRQL